MFYLGQLIYREQAEIYRTPKRIGTCNPFAAFNAGVLSSSRAGLLSEASGVADCSPLAISLSLRISFVHKVQYNLNSMSPLPLRCLLYLVPAKNRDPILHTLYQMKLRWSFLYLFLHHTRVKFIPRARMTDCKASIHTNIRNICFLKRFRHRVYCSRQGGTECSPATSPSAPSCALLWWWSLGLYLESNQLLHIMRDACGCVPELFSFWGTSSCPRGKSIASACWVFSAILLYVRFMRVILQKMECESSKSWRFVVWHGLIDARVFMCESLAYAITSWPPEHASTHSLAHILTFNQIPKCPSLRAQTLAPQPLANSCNPEERLSLHSVRTILPRHLQSKTSMQHGDATHYPNLLDSSEHSKGALAWALDNLLDVSNDHSMHFVNQSYLKHG